MGQHQHTRTPSETGKRYASYVGFPARTGTMANVVARQERTAMGKFGLRCAALKRDIMKWRLLIRDRFSYWAMP